jgi:hypothetical protein
MRVLSGAYLWRSTPSRGRNHDRQAKTPLPLRELRQRYGRMGQTLLRAVRYVRRARMRARRPRLASAGTRGSAPTARQRQGMAMRQAIMTKYLGPTNVWGTRVKAACYGGTTTIGWDHRFGSVENHARAARALAKKMGWSGTWYGGPLPNESGYAFVADDVPFRFTPEPTQRQPS